MSPEIIINIIIALVSFALGYFASVYLPLKFRKDDKAPQVSASPLQESGNYFDVTNHGGDILEMSIKIIWLAQGKEENRELDLFFNSHEDPRFGTSHKCNIIKRGETKKVISCPLYSDDGKVEVQISGRDVTGKKYEKILTLQNKVRGRM